MTVVCLVRHGESAWNRDGRIQGQRDPALSPRGRRQAEAVARRLAADPDGWAALYASDLARAARTAVVIGVRLGLPVELDPGLRERGQGRLEGLTADEALRVYPDFDAPDVGREPADRFGERCLAGLRRVTARHRTGRVVVVTHGGVIRRLNPDSAAPPANASVSIVDTETGLWSYCGDTGQPDVRHPVLDALMDAG